MHGSSHGLRFRPWMASNERFGGLLVGAQKMQREVGVPASLITAVNGLIVIFVVSSEIFIRRRARRRVQVVSQDNLAESASPNTVEEVS